MRLESLRCAFAITGVRCTYTGGCQPNASYSRLYLGALRGIRCAHDVSNAHQVIVDNVGKIVGRQSVRLDQDIVVQRVAVNLDMTVDHIVEAGFAGRRDVLANDIRLAASRRRWISSLERCRQCLSYLKVSPFFSARRAPPPDARGCRSNNTHDRIRSAAWHRAGTYPCARTGRTGRRDRRRRGPRRAKGRRF